jgi:hypothetical protein
MNSIKVTVLSNVVTERKGNFTDDKGNDRPYTTRKQPAKIECGGFAYPLDIRLEEGQSPYASGEYELDFEAMLQVNNGSISLSKFAVLNQLPKAAFAKAA